MEHDEFWSEVQQMNADQGNDNKPDSPVSPNPSEHTVFSQDELSFESTTTLPTPLREPRFTSVETIDGKRSNTTSSTTSAQSSFEKFVPLQDVPKYSRKDARFNRIRPTLFKDEEAEDLELAAWLGPAPVLPESGTTGRPSPKPSAMYRQSTGEAVYDETINNQQKPVSATTKKASKPKPRTCSECRARHVRCTHSSTSSEPTVLQPKSTNLRKTKTEEPRSDRKLRIKTEPGENRVKKDGTASLRNIHDRSKGPSMTPSAVDYRERKVVAQQYQDRLASMLDQDIVDQVEAEGWLTPLGRIHKAAVRMLERVQLERAGIVETIKEPVMSSGVVDSTKMFVSVSGEKGNKGKQYQQGEREVSPLDVFKAKLQALIDEGA